MAIYMKIDGIDGNVSAKGHEKWIEISSAQFGLGRSIPMAVGTVSNREASHPSFSEVTMTKAMDDASPYLFQEACTGTAKNVLVHVTKTGANALDNIVEYTLEKSMLSSYSISTDGDKPIETISCSYTKIEMKYIQWSEDHTQSSQIPVSYDLGSAVKG